jgi:N-acetylglucosaminyldiphosphoundecaprenol N-acetyl-beta-D-mannosaminyltransferase
MSATANATAGGGFSASGGADAVLIDGLPISRAQATEVLAEMERAISAGQTGRYISITNTESMYHGLRNAEHGAYIRDADFSLCDGVGVIVAGMAWGHRVERINGPVLQLLASDYGQQRKWRHFFYGGKEGVADEMARRLKAQFPDLEVCGTYCPPFRALTESEEAAFAEQIATLKPDIIWVGLGLIKQEKWIADHLERLDVPWMVGVGAAFDYHSGAVAWAPQALRVLGLEWLFRLIIQPRIRAKRYWWALVYVVQTTAKGLLTGQFIRKPQRLGKNSV